MRLGVSPRCYRHFGNPLQLAREQRIAMNAGAPLMPSISIVIPVFRSQNSIALVVEQVGRSLARNRPRL